MWSIKENLLSFSSIVFLNCEYKKKNNKKIYSAIEKAISIFVFLIFFFRLFFLLLFRLHPFTSFHRWTLKWKRHFVRDGCYSYFGDVLQLENFLFSFLRSVLSVWISSGSLNRMRTNRKKKNQTRTTKMK